MIEPYYVAICQAERITVAAGGAGQVKENINHNLQRYCNLIDVCCSGLLAGVPGASVTGPVKLVTFGEFSITGIWTPTDPPYKLFNREGTIKHVAIRIPGEETEVLAQKAKQYRVYVAAANLEHDPDFPDFFFNCGFIINPEGKIILKYRKTVTNSPIETSCSAHDVMDAYKNPITKRFDPFPVVETSIGKLAVMICGDIFAPEIPRVYSMKGAEVVLHLTSGNAHSGAGTFAPGTIEAALRTRAWDNAVYFVNSNWGMTRGILGGGEIAGYSKVYDYMGNELAAASDSSETIIRARIDIEAARRFRAEYFKNFLTLARTELYVPYYSQTIYPPNTFLRQGPIDNLLDEGHLGRIEQAKANLLKCADSYKETGV